MRSIAQLRAEHERIAHMREFLANALDPFRAIAVARALDFFTHYVEKYHHAKEEEVLVPALFQRAHDLVERPLHVMNRSTP